MQPRKVLPLLTMSWLGYWIISSASVAIVFNPDFMWRNNASLELFPNSLKSLERRSGLLLNQRRSSEATFTTYNIRRAHDIGSYIFGYDNAKDSSGNEHFRFEQRFANGTVTGEYGFTDYRNSVIVTVTYIADENGYRPTVNFRRFRELA